MLDSGKGPWYKAEHAKLDCMTCSAHCCVMAGDVEITLRDAARLAKGLKKSILQVIKDHCVEPENADDPTLCIKVGLNACQFLGDDNRCGVYAHRPAVCRDYSCHTDDKTCYETATALGAVPVVSA